VSSNVPPTEAANPRSAGLDLLETSSLVELLIAEQRHAVDAVVTERNAIARAVDQIAKRLLQGGRLHYVGAGSSARIAALDAAEMPPTFGTHPELVHIHVAGGATALSRAVEGAEDDGAAGELEASQCVDREDAVIGISASGGAAFVVAAVERSRRRGAYTVALTSVPGSPLSRAAENAIVLETGAEVLAGSTRMKAGTAQKVALNAISTAVMVRLGKVHDNLMVDLIAGNTKLRERAIRLICTLAAVDARDAQSLLEESGGRVKVAVVMARRGLDASQARALLDRHGGSLREAL